MFDFNSILNLPSDIISIGVPLQLLNNRPDVRMAESELKEAFYVTNYARASFYPSIIIGGSAGWNNSIGVTIINPAQFILSTVGSIVQPLFSQDRFTAQLKVAKLQQEQALLRFSQILFEAGEEINNALSAIQSNNSKMESNGRQIKSLETTLKSVKLLMQNGSYTYLEILLAQQSLLAAQLLEVEIESNLKQHIIILYRALGKIV